MKKYNYVGWCMAGSLGLSAMSGQKATAYHLDND